MGVFDHQLGMGIETTWGVSVTPTRFYDWQTGGGFKIAPRPVRSNAMRAGRRTLSADLSTRRLPGVTGDFTVDFETKGAGMLLRAIFGTVGSTGPAAGKYAHTFTLTATEPPGITLQQGVGRAGSVATMPFTGIGTKIVKATIGGKVGDNAAIGFDTDSREIMQTRSMTGTTIISTAAVTVTSTAGLQARMPVTGTGVPALATVLRVDSATVFTLSANATAGGTPTLTFGIALATASYATAPEVFLVDSATVTLGGVAVCASEFELSIDHGMKDDREKMCSGGLKDEQIRAQFGKYELKLAGVEYLADAQIDRMLAATSAGAQAQVVITLVGQSDPTAQCVITIPACEMVGDFPNIADMLVELDLQFDVLAPAAGGSEITIVYTTTDIAP